MTESSFYREPTKLHGKNLAEYAVSRIDEGLAEVERMTIEHSLGHAVIRGLMSAQDAYDCLGAYERAFNFEPDPDFPEAA